VRNARSSAIVVDQGAGSESADTLIVDLVASQTAFGIGEG
jgi:hypothetical protein